MSPLTKTLTKKFLPHVSGVGQEELDQLVEMMNNHIDGLTTDEKEHAVVDLIFSTGSRVLPGIRYLPLHWYPAGGQHPPTEIIDEANRNVDGEGLPIVDTDEETVAVVQGAGSAKRNHKDDVPMPSTSANLSDASTDSERGPGHYKKKRRAAPITWNTEEVIGIFFYIVHEREGHESILSGSIV